MSIWPDIPYARWKDTGASLHMWLQIIGKFRLAQTPWRIHSWQATFYPTARGLTTSVIPGTSDDYSVDLDFIDHTVHLRSTSGHDHQMPLEAISVADFYTRFREGLASIGAPTEFHGAPNELPTAVPFRQQTDQGAYDPDAAQDFWRAIVAISNVFERFNTSFLGKTSPVHLFWGSLDLAVTRFSGRSAPNHPGGIPNLPDTVTREAYSHEVSSAGFWAGGGCIDYPAFYSYAYPTPEAFSTYDIAVEEAFYSQELGEFVLPYEAVRTAPSPEEKLLTFLMQTYEAAAVTGNWDRAALECEVGQPRVPRSL